MSLVSFASHVAACGVGMAVFGVFGLWNPMPEASTFAPKRQGAPHGFMLRSKSVLPQSVPGRIFMFIGCDKKSYRIDCSDTDYQLIAV